MYQHPVLMFNVDITDCILAMSVISVMTISVILSLIYLHCAVFSLSALMLLVLCREGLLISKDTAVAVSGRIP